MVGSEGVLRSLGVWECEKGRALEHEGWLKRRVFEPVLGGSHISTQILNKFSVLFSHLVWEQLVWEKPIVLTFGDKQIKNPS
jgi:hypothetical protein